MLNTVDTCPSKTHSAVAPSSVAISIPLLKITTLGCVGCWLLPYCFVITPFSTGHGSFPLLLSNFEDNCMSASVLFLFRAISSSMIFFILASKFFASFCFFSISFFISDSFFFSFAILSFNCFFSVLSVSLSFFCMLFRFSMRFLSLSFLSIRSFISLLLLSISVIFSSNSSFICFM